MKYLLTRSEIDHKKIGLLGHSEGGIIAPMVAARLKDIAFIVLMAGPAVSGDKIISKQIEHLMHAGGATEIEIKTEGNGLKQIIFCRSHQPAKQLANYDPDNCPYQGSNRTQQ